MTALIFNHNYVEGLLFPHSLTKFPTSFEAWRSGILKTTAKPKDWMLPSTQNDVFDQMTAPVEHKHLRCKKALVLKAQHMVRAASTKNPCRGDFQPLKLGLCYPQITDFLGFLWCCAKLDRPHDCGAKALGSV